MKKLVLLLAAIALTQCGSYPAREEGRQQNSSQNSQRNRSESSNNKRQNNTNSSGIEPSKSGRNTTSTRSKSN